MQLGRQYETSVTSPKQHMPHVYGLIHNLIIVAVLADLNNDMIDMLDTIRYSR
jgi:hypothetical protein